MELLIRTNPHPWLVIFHGQKLQKHTFFSITENRSYETSIPELQNVIIRAYAHEWLVLEDIYSTDCCLWNPISNDKIQLPPLPYSNRLECLLSAPPHDPQCRLLFLIHETPPPLYPYDDTYDESSCDHNDHESPDDDADDENPDDQTDDDDTDNENSDDNENPHDDTRVNLRTLYLCKPGYSQEFHKQDLKSICEDNYLAEWTVFKGEFYALKFQSNILVRLDVDDDSGTITATPMTNKPPFDYSISKFQEMPRSRRYLIPSDDAQLLHVVILYSGKDFEDVHIILVFRFDFVKKVWDEVKSIGESAIFLEETTSCFTRGTHLKRDSIYFMEGRYLYVFHMKTQSLSLTLPCPHVRNTEPYSYWLTLPCQYKES
ncbi:unnamed protein product [Withania somnifera]